MNGGLSKSKKRGHWTYPLVDLIHQKIKASLSQLHPLATKIFFLLSVSKIMYPLGSLGNNKETQQAPEPSSSDYIIVTC